MIERAELIQDTGQFDRLPPHDLASERALLSSLIICGGDAEVFGETQKIAPPESFFQTDHDLIARMLFAMHAKGVAIDAVTLMHQLRRIDQLECVGGVAYLAKIIDGVPSHYHWRHYARNVRSTWMRRRVIAHASEVCRLAYAPDKREGDEIAIDCLKSAEAILGDSMAEDIHHVGALAVNIYDAMSAENTPAVDGALPKPKAIDVGFRKLQNMSGGLMPGEMMVIGARPSVGKSTILKQMAVAMAKAGERIAYFSLEESAEKVVRNILSHQTGILNATIRANTLTADGWNQLAEGVSKIASLPLWIIDRTCVDIRDIRNRLAGLRGREGTTVAILDYLQLVRDGGRNRDDEFAHLSHVSREVCSLGKKFGVAVIAACQLNRACEQRTDHRPRMSDLRGTGQIEQDADVVLFLHREDAFHIGEPSYVADNSAELIVAKWRDAQRDYAVRLREELRFQRFTELDESEYAI